MYTVTFVRPHTPDRVCRVRADNTADARERAVHNTYGPRAFWFADAGCPGYGQIFEPAPGGGNCMLTSRIRCDVTTQDQQ